MTELAPVRPRQGQCRRCGIDRAQYTDGCNTCYKRRRIRHNPQARAKGYQAAAAWRARQPQHPPPTCPHGVAKPNCNGVRTRRCRDCRKERRAASNRRRWQQIKNDPVLLDAYRAAQRKGGRYDNTAYMKERRLKSGAP